MPTIPPLPFFSILIVDDNTICSDILARLIASRQLDEIMDLRITVLHSAEEALTDLRTTCYDIIFTDVEMGKIHGDEMTRIIRSNLTVPIHKANRDVPIVATTARCDPDSRARYEEAGITQCLEKPVKKEPIYALIKDRVDKIIREKSK